MIQPAKRLEFIDAMRGFTMLLVVYSHVLIFGYHQNEITHVSFNQALSTFRMPLFFFISGFVLYKSTRIWRNELISFLRKKFLIQIIPTVFFLIVYDTVFAYDIKDSLLRGTKNGYWFTITLFEYFLMYSMLAYLIEKVKYKWMGKMLCLIVSVATLFSAEGCAVIKHFVPEWCLDLFGLGMIRYFSFFFLGTIVKEYYSRFCQLTDNGLFMALTILSFFVSVLFCDYFDMVMPEGGFPFVFMFEFRFLLTGIFGVVVIFTFFRKKERLFTRDHTIGKCLQYVGRRTLDIYFIHYFFLPRNLSMLGTYFTNETNPSIEFLISLLISMWVVILSVCVSNIIRLSDLLGHYLFGVKRKVNAG